MMAAVQKKPDEESPDGRLVQLAVSKKWLTAEQGRQAIEICAKAAELGLGSSLEEVLVRKGWITHERWNELLSGAGKEGGEGAGILIGKYRVVQKVGEGGMGAIFKVKKQGSDRVVALKLLSREVSKLKDWRARFQREAKVAINLDHPNIVRGIEIGQEKDRFYYVMEFIEGANLSDLIHNQGAVPEPRALEWMIQLAEGIDYIDSKKLVHRDIKPDNIIVTPQGVAKLTDLGLAKSIAANSPQITATGTAVGTPGYMSPEQIRGDKAVDIRTDLYSLGATFYFALTGRKPFEGDSFQEVLVKHLNDQLPSPKAHMGRLSDEICRIVEKLMAKERKDRYRGAGDLLKDLRSLQRGQPLVTREIPEGRSMVSRDPTLPTIDLKAMRARAAAQKRRGEFSWAGFLFKVAFLLLLMAAAGAAVAWWIFEWRPA